MPPAFLRFAWPLVTVATYWPRFASTSDPSDGRTFLSAGSAHYMNLYGDAPWELCGRESHADRGQHLSEIKCCYAAVVNKSMEGDGDPSR